MGARALWALLAALRAGWCLLPQSGYLHPDEFFQAPEVMAELMNSGNLRVVDLETLQGWNGAHFHGTMTALQLHR
ncbi:GPI mannosyltransferase 4 isoform X2 [Pseudopipra pipra]|uniref:GPI mannosyltransferase 4 isoform X2 n=1 Tax=Pseudopipra pipra TaxID=415032 RepID=UPI003139156C